MDTPSGEGSGAAASKAAPRHDIHNDGTATPTITSQELVDAFKNNGSFDAVRNEILKAFTASQAGEAFAARTQKVISDTLYDMYERPQQSNPASHARASSIHGSGIHTSPTRYGIATRSKQDATNYIYKELERHTAYDRALEYARPLINDATKSLDEDLEGLIKELTATKSAKTDSKEIPDAKSADIEMKAD